MRKLLEKHRLSHEPFPLIGGHRGCSCQFAENTIKAMEEGIRQGASYLEIDIQLTKDKMPVVYHDMELGNKTPLHGYVHEYTYEQIKEHWPVEKLEDVIGWGRRNDVFFALELKCEPAYTHEANIELLGLMDDIVKGNGMLGNVEAFGIDYTVLRELKKIDKDFEIGLIVPTVLSDPVGLMRDYDAMVYLAYSYLMDEKEVFELKKAGYYVSGAILRDERYMHHAFDISVDMFEHDEPAKALKALSSFQSCVL